MVKTHGVWSKFQGVWSKFLGCVVIVPVAILEKLAPMGNTVCKYRGYGHEEVKWKS